MSPLRGPGGFAAPKHDPTLGRAHVGGGRARARPNIGSRPCRRWSTQTATQRWVAGDSNSNPNVGRVVRLVSARPKARDPRWVANYSNSNPTATQRWVTPSTNPPLVRIRSPRAVTFAMRFRRRNLTVGTIPLCSRSLAARWSSLVARRAHNPKVVGSNPTRATIGTRTGIT